ncbi:XopAD/skwp family type III secretion system effector [Ralstonia solanacearum]|uniref:XopAD/skwp family type III secretion system effector n=1 Tax=Ralstonia solanacearum TaxID=305 RepID=UPI00078ED2C6|nr:Type III effector protein (Skwp 4) [Ralstonia solanacearum]
MERKRRRDVEASADARIASRPRLEDPPAAHPAASRASSRVGYDGGPANNQLVDYERWLDSSDLKLLRSQRERQCEHLSSLVKTSFRRKVDPQSCLRLARENVLAQHNGYGLALVFLHRSVPAEENTRRLVDYLLVLSKAMFQTRPRGRGDLGRCADLAAHYLFKTNWFEETPLHRLADLGNLLSKYPNRPACIEATVWIADQVMKPGRLPELNGKQLALLANAFSKHTSRAQCERAVARLASQLLHEPIEAFAAQGVTLLLNALSKWPGNAACRTAAEHLATRLARDDRLRQAMSAQEVASALNALSKWPDADACRTAAEHLAARLDKDGGLVRAMDAQGVANALNALSKWPDARACRRAAGHLAVRLAKDARLRQAMNAQGVANALNALSKWPDADACRVAAEHLAARLTKDDRLRRAMSAQHVANALSALSKWPDADACRTAAAHLAARLSVDAGLRQAMDARGVSNALNALSKWPETVACRMAAEHLADRLTEDAGLRQALDAQGIANALSALGKWPESDACHAATGYLAALLAKDDRLRQALSAQEVANALNGLSKWPESDTCRAAAEHLAARLVEDAGLRQAMDAQEIANALNALSKWPESDACRAAAEHLAAQLAKDAGLRQALDAQEIANALNALGKWPESDACHTAAGHLAALLVKDDRLRQALNAQEIANALNGLSKWPETDACRTAAEHLAARLAKDDGLRQAMSARQIAYALNALSKWPDAGACRAVAEHLAARLDNDAGLLQAMTALGIANTLNALSKWPDSADCRKTAVSLAALLSEDAGLRQAMDAQGIASVLNALSKWPESDACRAAAEHLAARLDKDAGLRQAMRAQQVANTLNALSKWPETDACRAVAEHLAARLAADAGLRQAMNAQGIANTLNALSKWADNALCREAAVALVDALGTGGKLFGTFGMRALAQLANGMARIALTMKDAMAQDNDAEPPDSSTTLALMHARLLELAAHLNVRPGGLNDAGTRSIAMIFKALSSTGLKYGLKLLADQGLQRLQALHTQTHFKPDDLETLGTLAAGLLPLVRAPELKPYRSTALHLLEQMQPDVARKIQDYADVHLASAGTATATRSPEGGAFGTRCPGLTFFLLLKTYAVVAAMWKLRNVPGDPAQVVQRREELKAWVGNTLERVRGRIEDDLDEMSWNLIAQIEAGDHVLDALDLMLWRDLDKIVAAHQPTSLDVAAVRRELRALPEVRDLTGSEAGAATLQIIDMRGRNIRSGADAGAQYSFFTRLTGGKLPLVEVELPGKLSAFMLARTIRRGGDLLRMDLFGGSHLTPQSVRVFERLAEAQSIKRYGRIPVVRLADTVPDAPLMRDVIRKLNPQREDWYRMQRALLEVVPRDHVVEGPVRLALLADRPHGAAPAFALRTSTGEPIHLASHDGCGFIRESLARRIPAMAQAMDAWQLASQKGTEALPTQRPSILPAQATHHYPRNEAAIEEARGHLRRALHEDATLWETDAFSGARRLSKPKLYDLLVAGGIRGVQGVAVPSADDKLYLPGTQSAVFDRTGGPVLLGKPPYDKPNLMPVPAERVGTSKQGDATARFLETAFAFQYSYTAWDESRSTAAGTDDDAPMLHGKGVTIVVPDALWPQDNDTQWVWSTEDMKVHSSWTQRRERDRLPACMDTVGSLRVKDIFTPGALFAVPIDELGKRDADCDGDKVFVYAGLPKMTQAITAFFTERERRIGRTASFKPPKTASAAFDETGRYHAGRAAEVLSTVRGRELVQRMSTLQFHFWGQPQALRQRIVEQAIFGTYEGTRRELRRGVRRLLYNPAEVTPAQLHELRERAHLGEQHAQHPVAREAAAALRSQLDAFVHDPQATREAEAQSPALSPALAQRFTMLAEAYAQARTPRERLAALVGHYPTALLPHPGTTLPTDPLTGTDPARETQLGYVPGAPLETLRNLLTLGVKVGTDAPKAVTQTDVYLKVADRLERALHNEPDRIRLMPYTKGGLLTKLREGLDVQAEQRRLRDNPTLAAGLMEMALEELQERGLIGGAPAPGDVSADTAARLRQLAHSLHTAAAQAEAHMTKMVNHAIRGIGVLRGDAHRLKSEHSLFDKLRRLMHKDRQTPEEAAAAVDDALRYSVVLAPETFVQEYAGILGTLDAQGLTRIRVRNSFEKAHAAFRGVNVGFIGRDGDGKTVHLEIQFHTQQTFDLKEHFHDDYKQAQSLHLAGARSEQQQAALAQARDAFDAVAVPPGCENIMEWDCEPPRTDRQRKAAVATAARTDTNEHVERLAAQARMVQREIGPVLEAIGLAVVKHHSVPKQAASIGKKIERYQVLEGLSIEQAAARIRDAMRWVVLLPAQRFAAEFDQARRALEEKGLRVMRISNGFAAAGATYAGLNATLRTASGLDFEMQFHTEDSLRARNTSHRTYRKWQDQEVAIRREQNPVKRLSLQQANARLLQERKASAATVPLPEGVKDIASFSAYQDGAGSQTRSPRQSQRPQTMPAPTRASAIGAQPDRAATRKAGW